MNSSTICCLSRARHQDRFRVLGSSGCKGKPSTALCSGSGGEQLELQGLGHFLRVRVFCVSVACVETTSKILTHAYRHKSTHPAPSHLATLITRPFLSSETQRKRGKPRLTSHARLKRTSHTCRHPTDCLSPSKHILTFRNEQATCTRKHTHTYTHNNSRPLPLTPLSFSVSRSSCCALAPSLHEIRPNGVKLFVPEEPHQNQQPRRL